ncbi:MAG: signal peptidase I [Chloroflexota bacterium]|nr:signal peptidase I [Chloroflexota bacterium]
MKATIRNILISVLLTAALFLLINSVIRTTVVYGRSMVPNLQNGQHVVVVKVAYLFNEPERGDVVVFNTKRIDSPIIHRIVGLPGETIELRNGELYVNKKRVKEDYLLGNSITIPPKTLPNDRYFVIGDNRSVSTWDVISRNDIMGKACFSYWPTSEWGLIGNQQYTE